MEVLYFSSTGPTVALLQLALNRLGFEAGAVDGIFGNNTLNALKEFQKSRGLLPSGVTWPETWDALRGFLLDQSVFIIPYSSNILAINLEGLKRQYPEVTLDVIGQSVLGEDLHRIRLGNRSNVVMFNAAHHANEWITAPLLMAFVFDICAANRNGANLDGINVSALLDKVGLDAIPMVDPDGVDLVTGQIKAGSAVYNGALALNGQGLPFPNGWKANIRGVDLNLNYPAGWERARQLKFAAGFTSPGPRDYVGSAPLSEPESRAMVEVTQNSNYLLTVSLHTQGQVIFWTFENYMPPRAFEIGSAMSAASGYALAQPDEFSSYAGYKDWFLQTYVRPGYTPECGLGVNPLPLEQFYTIYASVRPMLLTAMDMAAN